jgi:prolyl 4-hydroxylase
MKKEFSNIQVINTEPFTFIKRNFVSPEICDSIIQEIRPKLKKSSVVLPDGKNDITGYRTSSDFYINYFFKPNEELRKSVSEFLGIDQKFFEDTTIINYVPGQQYYPHYDYFFDDQILVNGQRGATVIIYLNDVEKLGHTIFPKMKVFVKPQKGSLLFFRYDYGEEDINEITYHAGYSPEDGEKWIATIWIKLFEDKK